MNAAAPKSEKNSRAVSLLKSWLRTVGISYRVSLTEGADLVVSRADGTKAEVQVTAPGAPNAPAGALILAAALLTGRRVRDALKAFDEFVKVLGYEGKLMQPVDRGVPPETKLNYHDHFEDVAFRHSELRRAPNPSKEDLLKYRVTMEQVVWKTVQLNSWIYEDHMLAPEDLLTYAQIWTTTFIAYFEHKDSEESETALKNRNERDLYAYLWQRFGELRNLLVKKGRSVLPDIETALLAQNGGERPVGWSGRGYTGNVDKGEDLDYIKRHCELDLRTVNLRRQSARDALKAGLANMPHDSMVNLLKEAGSNPYYNPDARSEALRQLKEHQEGCVDCVYLTVPASEEDE